MNAELVLDGVTYDQLPLDKAHPVLTGWHWGSEDQLGTLNYLTPSRVHAAAAECVRTGVRCSLNWDMTHPSTPGFGRQALRHEILNKSPRAVADDVIHFNTQHSTQWDGFRHFGIQSLARFYNNRTLDQAVDPASSDLGIGRWSEEGGGVAGRGVVLDVWGLAVARLQAGGEGASDADVLRRYHAPDFSDAYTPTNMPYDPFTSHPITFENLQDAVRLSGLLHIPKASILLVRSGYHARYAASTIDEIAGKAAEKPSPAYAGLAQCGKVARWLFDSKFAAVAGDAPAFERWPPRSPAKTYPQDDRLEIDPLPEGRFLHEIVLAGWGTPIGEMFYLEKLVHHARSLRTTQCFLAGAPLNHPAGVASPPNLVAMF
ncbi:hypothetical protein PYCC9005_002063 [Savitreella phatthalungensis]